MLYRLSFNVPSELHVFGFVHMQSLSALSKPLQAGIVRLFVVQFMFTDRICVVTPSYWG